MEPINHVTMSPCESCHQLTVRGGQLLQNSRPGVSAQGGKAAPPGVLDMQFALLYIHLASIGSDTMHYETIKTYRQYLMLHIISCGLDSVHAFATGKLSKSMYR